MGLFGWSYPPGAASDPFAPYNQEDPPCNVCGNEVDDCVCPECPVCHTLGDWKCYPAHGLTLTAQQVAARRRRAALEAAAEDEARAEAEYWNDPQRQVEAAELEAYWRDLDAHERGKA